LVTVVVRVTPGRVVPGMVMVVPGRVIVLGGTVIEVVVVNDVVVG
jgi:hypothetical protein